MKYLCVLAHSKAVACGILLVTCGAVILAQTNQGAIAGNIVDESGAVVVGAKVTAVSQLTGIHQETNSVEGGYRLPSLPVGVYDLSVEHTGFGAVKQTGIVVQVGSTANVNITLRLSATTQNIVVTAGATTVQQDTSDIGTVLSNREIITLPLELGGVGALRSLEAFKFLAPGTVGPGTQNSANGVWQAKTPTGGKLLETTSCWTEPVPCDTKTGLHLMKPRHRSKRFRSSKSLPPRFRRSMTGPRAAS